MHYNAIGLMSGSSMDGLDIAFVSLDEREGKWHYEWIATECVPYAEGWLDALKNAGRLSGKDLMFLHNGYGRYLGSLVNEFLERRGLATTVDLIASHGHTIFHEPAEKMTFQLGDGASLAAATGMPVVSDLRSMDVAHGGQGAPIVPLGEQLLFPEYDYWLNLGGIANITFCEDDGWKAFDVCACNQVLNALALQAGKTYDEDGAMAAKGILNRELFVSLNEPEYFSLPIPKSLDNTFSQQEILPLLAEATIPLEDKLRTTVEHIVYQIGRDIPHSDMPKRLLATGGGALNRFLIERLSVLLEPGGISVVVPDIQTVQYKEALIMAMLGALRLQGRPTVLNTVTGAKKDSIGGAVWLG